MPGIVEGKVAIVTGAGRGIGRATAMLMAEEGAKVLVNDVGAALDGSGGDAGPAQRVVEEIKRKGGQATASTLSIGEPANADKIVQAALDTFGRVDILVNNAGILRDRTLYNMEEADWDAVIAVHLKGHYCCTRPFARYIRETSRQGCRVINFSSVSGLYGNFGQSNYGAAKAGIAGLSRVLAIELAKYGCTVNTISPGAATRLTIDLLRGSGRDVDPEDPLQGPQQVAPVVTWLASPAAQAVSGQILHVMNGTLGIMQQYAVIRSFRTDHLWTQDDLDSAIPDLVEARRAHDARAKKEGEPEPLRR